MNTHRFHTAAALAATLTAGTLLPCPLRADSASLPLSDTDTVYIRFRQSQAELLPQLDGNPGQLERLKEIFGKDGRVHSGVSGIKVLGSASPEGSVEINRALSHRRAGAIHDYLNTLGEFPDSLFSFSYAGRDWQGLRSLVEADPEVPGRQDVLELLRDVSPEGLSTHDDDALLARLRQLDGGRTYSYLYANLFPRLRATRVVVDYPLHLRQRDLQTLDRTVALNPGPGVSPENLDAHPASDISLGALTAPRLTPPFYMSVGTNLLYDAAALPTVRLEFYLGRNWSAAANWTYGWWDSNRLHRYWRAYGGDIAVRRWFGSQAAEKPLTGHHAGVYAGIATYDFEWGGTGYMGGLPGKTLWDRCNYMAGLEYGYSLPVGRRLNLDFTIGIGCLWGKYIKYDPVDGYYEYRSSHNLHWFGPTKAEVSLVWLLGRGNYNKGKESRK